MYFANQHYYHTTSDFVQNRLDGKATLKVFLLIQYLSKLHLNTSYFKLIAGQQSLSIDNLELVTPESIV